MSLVEIGHLGELVYRGDSTVSSSTVHDFGRVSRLYVRASEVEKKNKETAPPTVSLHRSLKTCGCNNK